METSTIVVFTGIGLFSIAVLWLGWHQSKKKHAERADNFKARVPRRDIK